MGSGWGQGLGSWVCGCVGHGVGVWQWAQGVGVGRWVCGRGRGRWVCSAISEYLLDKVCDIARVRILYLEVGSAGNSPASYSLICETH